MAQIVDFNSKKSILTEEDFLDMFVMFKSKDDLGILVQFDLIQVMYSLPRWKNILKFKKLYENIEIKLDDNNKEYINLIDAAAKRTKEKVLVSVDNVNFFILANDELFNKQKEQYTRTDLEAFRQLMFYINNDLEFGTGNWEILSEDEIIQVPGYPSYVSGEFIGQDKTQPSVKKMMKDRAKEHLKNLDS